MDNEEMAEIIQKISSMMNNSNFTNSSDNSDIDSSNNIESVINNSNNQKNNFSSNAEDNNNINFDFETIMKIKNIMDTFNSNKNTPETNLLRSLKPYLNNNRKQKLDQYINLLNITKVIDAFNSNGEVNSK